MRISDWSSDVCSSDLLQLLDTREGVEGFQAEVVEEGLGGAPGDRAARRLAAPLGTDPADLQQRIEGALGQGDAPDLLDLGAGHRLVVGDPRQGRSAERRVGKGWVRKCGIRWSPDH